jgi:hypothetical protein
MPFPLHISVHGEQRWVERIVDPKRYNHLESCRTDSCETCNSLIQDIRRVLANCGPAIRRRIQDCYSYAKEQDRRITDPSFLQAVGTRFNMTTSEFYQMSNGILVVATDSNPPTLVTVLSLDMLTGTVFRNLRGDDLKEVFGRWKFETKQRSGH